MNKNLIAATTLAAALMILAPITTYAEAGAGARVSTRTASTSTSLSARAAAVSAVLTRAKDRADQEIERRTNRLQELANRIGDMTRLSDADKASLQQTVMEQVSALSTLKSQIEADMSTSSLKTAVQSITKSYRIYALIVPQTTILAAADRTNLIVAQLQALAEKLSARLTAAAAAGHDVSTLQKTLTDYSAKVSDAATQAQAAVTEVQSLKPDNGDQAVLQANMAALKDARTKLQAAHQDLQTARKDAETIVKGLRSFGTPTHAASTTPAS